MGDFITLLIQSENLSMEKLLLIGLIGMIWILLWQFSNIINAIANMIKTNHEINKE